MTSLLKNSLIVFALISAFSLGAVAEEEGDDDSSESSNFVCGRSRGASLSAFKERLTENCNLNKHFSIAVSQAAAAKQVFVFCCHSE